MMVWKNLDQWLLAAGALIIPEASNAWLVKIVTQTLGITMLVGVVRLVRGGRAFDYAVFAVPFSLMLIAWHGPPTERLISPIYPLLLAGFWCEMRHIVTMLGAALRHRERSQRAAAAIMGTILAVVLAGGAWTQYEVGWRILPREVEERREERSADEAAFRWMAAHLPAGAQLVTYNDPVLFLYTGHRACSLILPSMHWYRNDSSEAYGAFAKLADFARAHGLDYAYFTLADFRRRLNEGDRRQVIGWLEGNPELEVVHRFPSATLYRVRPSR
jgi:hypothetical protein